MINQQEAQFDLGDGFLLEMKYNSFSLQKAYFEESDSEEVSFYRFIMHGKASNNLDQNLNRNRPRSITLKITFETNLDKTIIPFEILAKIVKIFYSYNLKVGEEFFYRLGYFPIEDNFMNFLLLNYNNCVFFTFQDQTYINLNEHIERKYDELINLAEKPDKLPSTLKYPTWQIWNPFGKSRDNLVESIQHLIQSEQLLFLESILVFYENKLTIDHLFIEYLDNYYSSAKIVKIPWSFSMFLMTKNRNIGRLFLEVYTDAYQEKKDPNIHTKIKSFIKQSKSDRHLILFSLICKIGDLECLNLYAKNLINQNKSTSEYKRDIIKNSLKDLYKNENIKKPQEQYYRFNSLLL